MAWSTGDGRGGGVYVAFNAAHKAQVVELPHWPGLAWRLVADTSKVRGCAPAQIRGAGRLPGASNIHVW